MNPERNPFRLRRITAAGFTLTELMVASSAGLLLMTAVVALGIFSSRSFSAMSNYADLDGNSRYALDIISREVRDATVVTALQTNLPTRSITLNNTTEAAVVTFTWDSAAEKLYFDKTGQARKTLLTGCDQWNVSLYTRAPNVYSTNIVFNQATTLSSCKMVNMSWRCYRTVIGQKLNTESVQTAQIVLRNKVN